MPLTTRRVREAGTHTEKSKEAGEGTGKQELQGTAEGIEAVQIGYQGEFLHGGSSQALERATQGGGESLSHEIFKRCVNVALRDMVFVVELVVLHEGWIDLRGLL